MRLLLIGLILSLGTSLAACNQQEAAPAPAAQTAPADDGGDSFELEIDGENDSVRIKAEDDNPDQ